MPTLTVHNAQVQTATVEIRTLTISGKQVTLAVFRQLKSEAFVNHDGSINGVPWGVVNYHPDKCDALVRNGRVEPNHVHIVWQSGPELRRAVVDPPTRHGRFWDEACDWYVEARHCASGHQWANTYGDEITFEFGGMRCGANKPRCSGGPEHGTDPTAAATNLTEAIGREAERRSLQHQRWAEIQDLPQLFIAV